MKIPLIPALIYCAVTAIINVAVCSLFFVISLPKRYLETLWKSIQLLLTIYPQSIREILKLYDCDGLRHNIHHLQDNAVRKKIALAEINLQCQYVDLVTRRMIPKAKLPGFIPNTKVNGEPRQPVEYPQLDMTKVNTTVIGNLAWSSLYHWDEGFRNKCKEHLVDIRDYFSKMP